MHFRPRKTYVDLATDVDGADAWKRRFEEVGVEVEVGRRFFGVTLTPKALKDHKELLTELINAAVRKRGED